MSENQSQAINIAGAAAPPPLDMNVSKKPMLIEVPVNTAVSPSKASQRLAQYTSPRKDYTLESLNERLNGAEQRREEAASKLHNNKQEKLQKVQKKQEEMQQAKKAAAAAKEEKLAKVSAKRESITSQKAKKIEEHNAHAKEVCSSIKKAEQADYQKKRDEIEAGQKAAAAKRDSLAQQAKKKLFEHAEKVHDTIAQKGKEAREKKAALDQKLKDAEARRNVAEVAKTLPKTKAAVKKVAVIEIDTTEIAVDTNTNAKVRLEAQKKADEHSLETVEQKLRSAGERREQLKQQKLASPKAKRNAEKVAQNREQLESEKQAAVAAAAKRAAEAEAKAKAALEAKAKKAGEHNTKVEATATARQETAQAELKSKAEAIASKQQAAAMRAEAQLQQRKDSAASVSQRVGEKARAETDKLKEKKQALDQKMADHEARRRVVEQSVVTHNYCSPAKLRPAANEAGSPKRAAKPPAPPAFAE
jgi:colicin import membrane protein